MSLLPLFDAREPEADELFSVGELTERIKAVIGMSFSAVGVRGEASGVSRPRSGHVYFQLKDESATLRAVIWRGIAQQLVFDLEDGLAIRVYGEIDVYAPRGEYQLIVRAIEPEGIGALDLAFRQVIARLSAEGLFDPARKRPLPKYPRRIAIVTSPTGAAVRDMIQVLHRRWPAVELLVIPVRVQGPGAAEEIALGIELANEIADVDVVIAGRGGGSLEDLWAFNEEVVARAIFHSRLAVVSAVGHEVDVTVADLVADVRALTPTDAAVRCVPDVNESYAELSRLRDRLTRATSDHLTNAKGRVKDLGRRAERAMALVLERRHDRLKRLAAQLEALSPLSVLSRGYSLTFRNGETTPLRSAATLRHGDLLQTRFAEGTVISRIESPGGTP